ncbi:MAG TPA: hypothetical protein VMU92_00330 [Acidobacteriaceae bacterium]|nr:hypothetical protein [Acidobacteriaceae bacterium]
MKISWRARIILSIAVVVLLLLAGALYLRMKSPPEVTRLLPECDGIVYLNLRPLRAATHFDQHPVQHDADYQHFIDATGINPERDLDQVAFALQRMPNPNGPNGLVAFSEVFEGHFDGRRLADYLKGIAASTETYAGRTVYMIPHDGRTVRVALLGRDMVAVSNTPTEEQIHSILDRYRTAALPFTESSLLAAHYSDVPLLSPAWGIGKIGLPLNDSEGGISVLGINLPLSSDTTFVASLHWVGKTRLRVVEIAPTAQAAASSAEAVNNLLQFVRNIEISAPPDAAHPQMQADVQALLNSAKVTHRRKRAVFTATIPSGLLEQLMHAPVQIETAPEKSPQPQGKKGTWTGAKPALP